MTRLLMHALFVTLARALLTHCCGEVFRMTLHHFAPRVPPFACAAIGLLLAVVLAELAAMLWRRTNRM